MDGFFAMGGHAAYIWPAYGVVAVVLAGLFAASRRFRKAADAEFDALNPRGRRRRADHADET